MKAVSTKISEFMSKQVEAINIIYVNGFNFLLFYLDINNNNIYNICMATSYILLNNYIYFWRIKLADSYTS